MKNYLNNFNLKGKKALIFGGCGLVGEKVCEAFLSAGAKVNVLDYDKKKGNELEKKYKKFSEHINFCMSKVNNL